jgi:putative hydrolase of the HAD superfamily
LASEVRCVVFDVDDTLYLERDYVRSGVQAVGALLSGRYGVAGFAAAAWDAFESGVRGTIFDQALAQLGITADPALIRELIDAYRAHEPAIAPLAVAVAAIEALQGVVRLAAITDGPPVSQRAKVSALSVDRWADPVVLCSELGPGCAKPDPTAFRAVEAHTALAGRRCMYVADNPAKDFAGPASLGWLTVRIRRPGSLHESVPSGADVTVEITDLTGLPALVAAS